MKKPTKNRTVSFRPSEAVKAQLARLSKANHVNRSWAINRALQTALPAVLDRIGV